MRQQEGTPRMSSGVHSCAACHRIVRTHSMGATGLFVGLGLLALPSRAEVAIDVQVSARQAEVNQPLQLQATAMADDGEDVSNPTLVLPPGLVARGPTLSTQNQISIGSGGMVRRSGLTASWSIVANRTGSYSLGPVSFAVDGGRASGATAAIEIVPQGTLPQAPTQRRRRGPFGFDPFEDDPFDMFPPGSLSGPGARGLFGQSDDLTNLPPYPEELQMEQATDSMAFLRAEVKPERAVIGQQLTFTVYAYGAAGPFAESASSEASRADFFTLPMVDSAARQRAYRVPIGDQVFHAAKIRQYALFPLHTGQLQIGRMRMGFVGRSYPDTASGQGLIRYSPALTVEVNEPPQAGRPLDYQVGDVGDYRLEAVVEPREVETGQSVSVVATLTGYGNLPNRLAVPEQESLEWLEPNLAGEVKVQKDGRVGGTRTFTYIVKVKEEGDLDLGELRLPYYSPTRKGYIVAAAKLGSARVHASSVAANTEVTSREKDQAKAPERSLSSRLTLRPIDLGPVLAERYWTDSHSFWWGLLAGPLGLAGVGVSTSTMRGVRRRWQQRKVSPQVLIRNAFKAAERASKDGLQHETARELERAVYLTLEAKNHVRARALLRSALCTKLEQLGVPAARIQQLQRTLDEIDALRIAPPTDSTRTLVKTTEALCDAWPNLVAHAVRHA